MRAQEGPAGVPGPPGPGLDGPGSPVTKRSTFCHVLSRWRVGREEGSKSHSQTLNMDLSLPDRGRQLGLASTDKARGPGAEARHRRRSLVVEPDCAGEASIPFSALCPFSALSLPFLRPPPFLRPVSALRHCFERRLCQDDIFERGEGEERGRAARHIKAVTPLARIQLRAPFPSPEVRPHQQAPNRDSMISGMGRWRLRVECL